MHKAKPTKGIGKRFKVTARGKLMGNSPGKAKLMSHKPGRRKQRLRRKEVLCGGLADRLLRAMREL